MIKILKEQSEPLYVSVYREYPIYEPAEGGYYYEGTELIEWCECDNNEELIKAINYFYEEYEYGLDWPEILPLPDDYVVDINDKFYGNSRYIGEGIQIIVEAQKGSNERGWVPYE